MKFTLDFTQFLRLDYWLNPNPGVGQLLFLIISLKISILLLISGIIIRQLNKRNFFKSNPKRSFFTTVMWTLYSFSAISFVFTFFRIEAFGWVTLRLLWLLMALGMLIFSLYFLLYYFRSIPTQLKEIETENLKKKYFRTKKK